MLWKDSCFSLHNFTQVSNCKSCDYDDCIAWEQFPDWWSKLDGNWSSCHANMVMCNQAELATSISGALWYVCGFVVYAWAEATLNPLHCVCRLGRKMWVCLINTDAYSFDHFDFLQRRYSDNHLSLLTQYIVLVLTYRQWHLSLTLVSRQYVPRYMPFGNIPIFINAPATKLRLLYTIISSLNEPDI